MIELSRASRCDLHLHTLDSDGRFEPGEVLKRCAAAGLDLVALTDHDRPTRLRPGRHELEDHAVHVLAGAEVSGVHEGHEFHLLVYFPDEVPVGFRDFCQLQCQARAARYAAAVASLGLPELEGPDAEAVRGDRALTRHHLARRLVAAGHARSTAEAFTRFLDHRHGHVPCMELSFLEAIRVARAFGGVTSWAHPPLQAVRDHVAPFAAAGLQGLEALRPRVNGKARKTYKKAAKRHGLFLTGGSDWHGWKDPALGLFQVPAGELAPFFEALAAA